ncbi:hypothetical protein FOTG_19057 [Fusarium oxysporum f. sp. vasinfectum 25433]|uniref:Uncharacterized protein n=1 Tax=Fusarium oxysporum f. sp. vasinfectum 25433 TaxID=1089449 RepID=X0KUH6_FUSOX|nr:hypothetical protein FOTG_19057 [Fusarium oxysporum f. sp. vasinfectum 25433]
MTSCMPSLMPIRRRRVLATGEPKRRVEHFAYLIISRPVTF